MFILNIRLIGYVGIFNGVGVKDLYIDFSKSNKGLFIIIGDNGSGKSTLLDSLSPLPDDNKCFIKQEKAEKILNIRHGEINYRIHCIHGVNNKGERENTKVYFYKYLEDGTELNLNPNGNVTSYKETLFDEFTLDANFLALSALSSTNKGIGLMTGGERKKYVNSIISNLVTYNTIYKVLCKRSNIFKSMVNNISNKISSLGDRQKLELTLASLENRINIMLNDKDKFNIELATYKSKLELLDPNNSIQNSYDNILAKINEINNSYINIDNDIKKTLTNNFNLSEDTTPDQLVLYNNDINNKYSDLEVKIRVEETNINNLFNNRENESKLIQDKIAKLDSIKLGINDSNVLMKTITDLKKDIDNNVSLLNNIGISEDSDISKEEFITGINILNNIRDTIISYKSDKDYGMLKEAFEFIKSNNVFHNVESELNNLKNDRYNLSLKYNKYCDMEKSLTVLEKRPDNCMIPTCAFIKSALDNKLILDKESSEDVNNQISILDNSIIDLEYIKAHEDELKQYVNTINNVIRDIKIQSSILNKLPLDMDMFYNMDTLESMIIGGYQFPEIKVLYENIQYADLIKIVKDQKVQLNILEQEFELHKNKYTMIENMTVQINELNDKINIIRNSIDTKQKEISNYKDELSALNTLKICFNNIMGLYTQRKELDNKKNELLSIFNNIKNDMYIIKQSLDNINTTTDKIEYINKELTPILQDRDTIKFNLSRLKEYEDELEMFNKKYQKVETIKYYCSPSKDGIQNVFIELYMNKTLQLTNEILSMLFNGDFMIDDFIINDKDFNIPVVGNGIMNDDISSMSNAQISMISMIISFVILYQSSSKYNIIKLDEVDAPLDSKNRLQFTFVLEKIREILKIEQTIMITHNNETNYSDASLIIFNTDEHDKYKDYDIIFDINAD